MNFKMGLFLLCMTSGTLEDWHQTPKGPPEVISIENVDLGFKGNQTLSTVNSHNRTVMCVFDSWAMKREGHGKFGVEDVDETLCKVNRLPFSLLSSIANRHSSDLDFVHTSDTQINGDNQLSELIGQAVAIKRPNSKMKLILSVRGKKEDFEGNSSAEDRQLWNFVKTAPQVLKDLQLDGLNVEWKWTTVNDGAGQRDDWYRVTLFIDALSNAMKNQNLELGLTLPPDTRTIERSQNIKALERNADYLIIRAQDFADHRGKVADHHSPLFPVKGRTVANTVKFVLDKNISSHKFILGIPFIGRTFELNYSTKGNGLGAPILSGKGLQGVFNTDAKVLNYNEICHELTEPENDWTVYEDTVAKVPFMKDRNRNWVSFENTKSVEAKVEFGEEQRLGGYAAWSITNDDFEGKFCGDGITYPLLRTINYILSKKTKSAKEINPTATESLDLDTETIPSTLSTPQSTTTEIPSSQEVSLETTSMATIPPPPSVSTQTTTTIKKNPTTQNVILKANTSQTVQPPSSVSAQPTPSTKYTHNDSVNINTQSKSPLPRQENDSSKLGNSNTNHNASVNKEAKPTSPLSRNENQGRANKTESVVVYVVVTLLGIILLLAVVFILVWRKRNGNKNELSNSEVSRFKNGYTNKDVKYRRNTQAIVLEQLQAENNINCSPYDDSLEIPHTEYEISADEILQSGAYGVILRGKVRNEEVAVKTVKPLSIKSHVLSLMEEIKVMTYLGKHEHILSLIGVNTALLHRGFVFVFLEFCPLGSLEKYLKETKSTFVDLMNNDEFTCEKSRLKEDAKEISTATLLIWAHQISKAMQFLACKKVIHGDLGTRNVRVCRKHLVKVSEFILSRKMYAYCNCINNNQVNNPEEPLPWRHMSLETLTNLEFSTKSDAWAFGVTLWEIFSLGALPYPGMSYTFGFTDDLKGGRRMSKPRHATTELYEKTMLQTWNENPQDRPSFEELCSFLHDAVERVSFQQECVQVNVHANQLA